jgi:hypothetical protein
LVYARVKCWSILGSEDPDDFLVFGIGRAGRHPVVPANDCSADVDKHPDELGAEIQRHTGNRLCGRTTVRVFGRRDECQQEAEKREDTASKDGPAIRSADGEELNAKTSDDENEAEPRDWPHELCRTLQQPVRVCYGPAAMAQQQPSSLVERGRGEVGERERWFVSNDDDSDGRVVPGYWR